MPNEFPPSIKETAFSCPHCGAYTTHYWYNLYGKRISGDSPTPNIPDRAFKEVIKKDATLPEDRKNSVIDWIDQILSGQVFIEFIKDGILIQELVENLYLSKCYNCKNFSVWVHDCLLFPRQKISVAPNQDLPEDIIFDFEEAREIAEASPRGAAALLRLCIQKLCKHLGEKGKNIDDDIGNLVKKGLNPLVQKSLDIVRVIGNEAVHPGVLDLKDDRETAMHLFELVNAIADQMISHPMAVESLYEKLPESKREAIAKRDGKK